MSILPFLQPHLIFVSELAINKVLHKKMKYCYGQNNNVLKKATNDLQL